MSCDSSLYSYFFLYFSFFFFNDTATTEIYTLSLHDALPIFVAEPLVGGVSGPPGREQPYDQHALGLVDDAQSAGLTDRKSTRLNSSHSQISYAVFCLKKKKKTSCHPMLSVIHFRPRLLRTQV